MADRQKSAPKRRPAPVSGPQTRQPGRMEKPFPKYVLDNLFEVQGLLDKETRVRLGLVLKVPIFIKDSYLALEQPSVGVQSVDLRLEPGLCDGPTSARIAVVDYNFDTQILTEPVVWDAHNGWFRSPLSADDWLPYLAEKSEYGYFKIIEEVILNPYSRQVNVWAVVQRVLEFYEEPWALGRPVPWGFDGNRLIVVPHAGYGKNAYYDRRSKSLQFYYFGDQAYPFFTCLSHDVVVYETSRAILDGIRPLYYRLSSPQTAAFQAFVGDLTAILLALSNEDIRRFIASSAQGRPGEPNILAAIAPEFGAELEARPFLRTAFNALCMRDIKDYLSPRFVSQVMTGAMWDILSRMVAKKQAEYWPKDIEDADEPAGRGNSGTSEAMPVAQKSSPTTFAQVLWWAAYRFRRVALQPLDLCPPCDIQFIDYARAVIRNDILTNPVDDFGHRQIMLDVFHQRGLCPCDYRPGEPLPENCQFWEALQIESLDFVFLDIDRISRSKTAASYFLNDNAAILRIPAHKNFRVVDLYDNNKYSGEVERLPREVVLEYAWKEDVQLEDNRDENLSFGPWNGKVYHLDCGGTLVFDDRGNLLSWFRKPGTEHMTSESEKDILQRLAVWSQNPKAAQEQKITKPTRLELSLLSDLNTGRQRRAGLLRYLAALIRHGLVDARRPDDPFTEGLRPIVASEEDGVVQFEFTPQSWNRDLDMDQEEWIFSY